MPDTELDQLCAYLLDVPAVLQPLERDQDDDGWAVSFVPVSPPPHLSGGPSHHLSWVVAAPASMPADEVAQLLRSKLPHPVGELDQWVP